MLSDLKEAKEARVCSGLRSLRKWDNFMTGYLNGSCLEGEKEGREVKTVIGKEATDT